MIAVRAMPIIRVYPKIVRPHWVTCYFSAVGLTYSRSVKTPPTSWADLWRPEFKGRIVIPDVTHTIGLYPVVIGALAQGKDPKDATAGFEMLKRLADLKPIVAKDTDTIMNSLQSGEALIGLLYKSQTFTIQDKGAKVALHIEVWLDVSKEPLHLITSQQGLGLTAGGGGILISMSQYRETRLLR